MRRTILTLIALALTAGPALADPSHGLWKTQPDDNGNYGHVQMQTCSNGRICGGLVAAFGPDGQTVPSDNIGRAIVWDMVADGDGGYDDGKVYAPDRDKTYSAKMELRGNTLGVSGCVFGICRESVWTRQR